MRARTLYLGSVKVSYLWVTKRIRSISLDPNNFKRDVMCLMASIRVFLAATPLRQTLRGFSWTYLMFRDFQGSCYSAVEAFTLMR